jgi:hypothetical protein
MLRDDLSNVTVRSSEPGIQCRSAQVPGTQGIGAHSSQIVPGTPLPQWLLIVTLLAVCAVPLSNNISDPDLWGHVQYGLDVLQDGLQYTATYTYSAEGARWISHENLAEVLFALGMQTLGPTAVLMLKTVLGVAVIGWMLERSKCQGVGLMTAFIVFPLVAMNLMHFWNIRPQTLSFLLFTAIVVVLEWSFVGWRGEWRLPVLRTLFTGEVREAADWNPRRLHALWLLPLLMSVWTNTHGAFLAGCCVISAYLACRSIELWFERGSAALISIRYLALILLATLLSTLINPLGWDLHAELYQRLAVPRPEIIEWQPPEFWSIVWVQFWVLLALAAAALLLARRPRDFTHMVIFVLVAWQAVEHRRHIAFVALLFGLWFPPLVESLFRRLKGQSDRAGAEEFTVPPSLRWSMLGGLSAVCLLTGCLLYDQLQILPVRKDRYPVEAFQFMRDQRLDRHGKLVCQFEWAQYAIMAFGQRKPNEPGLRVQFDGRFRELYPQEVLDMYWDFDFGHTAPLGRYRSPNSPPISPARVLSHLQPDLVLMSRERPRAIAVLEEHQDEWALLYQDSLTSLWGRRTRYDNPTNPDYLPPGRRRIDEAPQQGVVAWPALPVRRAAALDHSSHLSESQPHARNDS